KAFHEQVGLVKAPDRRPTTSVAVIDTAARKFWDPTHDNYGHGRLMGRVIADLACGDAKGCEGRLNNQLGLPHLTPSLVDTTYGGVFVRRGQQAEAISGAVDEWRLNSAVGAAVQHLILNLSVGWDPVKTADKNIPSKVTDDAVYLALARASCFGAVAIAAAGNSDGI